MHRILTATLLAVFLTGCKYVSTPLPDLDVRLTQSCGPATAKAGEDVRLAAKRKEAARRCEAGKRIALVGFYENLRLNRKGQ
jgi:hypothetical protein